jgi:hypothetical protein
MTKEEQFIKDIEQKIQQALQEDKHQNEKQQKIVTINDDIQDWGGCSSHYNKEDSI